MTIRTVFGIQITRMLLWAELTKLAATIALSGTRVTMVSVARMSTSAFSGVTTQFVSLALASDVAPTRAPAHRDP